jgi:hypothetical protein
VTESTSKYDFTLEIEEHFLAQNNRVLNKYFVNKTTGRLTIDSLQFLNPDKIYYVEYSSDSTIKNQFNYFVNGNEKDTIFALVKDLFNISDPTGIRKSKPEYYEGRYTIIRLELDNCYTRYTVSIGLEDQSINKRKYYTLLKYINR